MISLLGAASQAVRPPHPLPCLAPERQHHRREERAWRCGTTESSRLEKTSGSSSPACGRTSACQRDRGTECHAYSSPTLPSRDGDPTASAGSAFRCLSALSVQTLLLMSNLKELPAREDPAHGAAATAEAPLTPPPAFRASQWQGRAWHGPGPQGQWQRAGGGASPAIGGGGGGGEGDGGAGGNMAAVAAGAMLSGRRPAAGLLRVRRPRAPASPSPSLRSPGPAAGPGKARPRSHRPRGGAAAPPPLTPAKTPGPGGSRAEGADPGPDGG